MIGAFSAFLAAPRPSAVYNLGGGKGNSVSILESIDRIDQLSGRPLEWTLSEQNRIGDHIVYYTDLSRFQADYPDWRLTMSIDDIFDEFARVSFSSRSAA